jgi:hypothetical protein
MEIHRDLPNAQLPWYIYHSVFIVTEVKNLSRRVQGNVVNTNTVPNMALG